LTSRGRQKAEAVNVNARRRLRRSCP
jgi:hypothetical protein